MRFIGPRDASADLGRALLCVGLLAVSITATAQEPATEDTADASALRVFLDCDRGCDFNFVRQEMDFINWVRDRKDAEIHLLVTRQATGGGIQFQLEFLGMERFLDQDQILLYSSSSTDTDDERRRGFVRIVGLGLARYIAQTPLAAHADLVISAPRDADGGTRVAATPAADPWNFWVISLGIEGFTRGEDRFDGSSIEADVRASRTTEAWKLRVGAEYEYEEDNFEFDDGSAFKNINRSFDGGAQAVKSLGEHWGAGVGASARQSNFFNLAPSYRVAGALEYNIYPYALSSQRQLTFTYFLGGNRFSYEEETIFEVTEETLVDQGMIIALDLERPWGSASIDLQAMHFLQLPSEFNLTLDANLEYRILRGLSLDLSGGIESIRSQRYLPLGGATDEEVLLERRALATDFRFSVGLGIRYTFGSIFNNVVNARLSGNRRGFHTIF